MMTSFVPTAKVLSSVKLSGKRKKRSSAPRNLGIEEDKTTGSVAESVGQLIDNILSIFEEEPVPSLSCDVPFAHDDRSLMEDNKIKAAVQLDNLVVLAKSEVNLQTGDVLEHVINELFCQLQSLYCYQQELPSTDETVNDAICHLLYALDLVWIKYAMKQSSCCQYFLTRCADFETFVIASPLLCVKGLKFSLFRLLRRKALWLKHACTENNSEDTMTLVNDAKAKLWMFILLGKRCCMIFSLMTNVSRPLLGLVLEPLSNTAKTLQSIMSRDCTLSRFSSLECVDLLHATLSISTICSRRHDGDATEECDSSPIPWKDFNCHFFRFICWILAHPTVAKKSRFRAFSAVGKGLSTCGRDDQGVSMVGATVLSSRRGVTSGNFITEHFPWLILVLQSVVLMLTSGEHDDSSTAAKPKRIVPNWAFIRVFTTNELDCSLKLSWLKRSISLLSIWDITTDAYDFFQDTLIDLCSIEIMPLPWNEYSLIDKSRTPSEREEANYVRGRLGRTVSAPYIIENARAKIYQRVWSLCLNARKE